MKYKKIVLALLAALLVFSSCTPEQASEVSGTTAPPASTAPQGTTAPQIPAFFGEDSVSAAVVHYGEGGGYWRDTLSRLEQSTTLGIWASALDTAKSADLSGFDLLYLDESIMSAPNANETRQAVVDFVSDGGYVFLTNGFCNFFDKDFIGAHSFEKLTSCPTDITVPPVSEDLAELQEAVADFFYLYPSFRDFAELSSYDYGYAVKPSTAVPLIMYGELALYTINDYGAGKVLLTNPVLPNAFAVNGFSMEPRDERQISFSDGTAAFNRLLEGRFAALKMCLENGFSAERVYGAYGNPAMSWELHFEEITGIINNSAEIFGEMCREYGQIPSFTLVRSTYWWFMRAESVTYLTNVQGGFESDEYENAYSSGTHIAAGGEWLALARFEDGISYFDDDPSNDQTAYPALLDFDGDGLLDIISGSSDGYFYFFKGQGFTDRLHTAAAVKLTDGAGEPIRLKSHSAPTLADVNGDGISDIISGSGDGKIYWFSGVGGGMFEYEGLLLQFKLDGRTLPYAGDLDGDGCTDLIIGSDTGLMSVVYGGAQSGFSPAATENLAIPDGLGHWLAPVITGKNTLAAGTFHGYVANLTVDGASCRLDGYITGSEQNYKGNYNHKFGNNSVPRFADLNGDGALDLLCGSLEYGLAYPIDSEYFPYREQLEAVVGYITDNGFYVGPHFLTKEFASPGREADELELHRAAMASYGLDFDMVGTNHHTWFTSTFSPSQTFESQWQAGLLWDSGFSPAGTGGAAPQVSAKNVVALPYFLMDGAQRTLLVANCSTLLHSKDEWTDLSAKYNMPISIFYHCEFAYRSAAARTNIERAEAFRRKHGYSFVSEDQQMLASAAAINLAVDFSSSANGFTLTPRAQSEDFALYDPLYQSAVGVRLTLRSDIDISRVSTDASVWRVEGRNLYISLDKSATVRLDEGQSPSIVARVNIPAQITDTAQGAQIAFKDGGLMEVTVRGQAATSSPGWTAVYQDGMTSFWKFGEMETIDVVSSN